MLCVCVGGCWCTYSLSMCLRDCMPMGTYGGGKVTFWVTCSELREFLEHRLSVEICVQTRGVVGGQSLEIVHSPSEKKSVVAG
jgi:hypothetical protein